MPSTSRAPRRGRRPGAPDTRATILDAARSAFAEKGFAGTTIRAVASMAGVDAALVHHYFGTKDDLFLAAMELPFDPAEQIPVVLAGDPDGVGERLVRLFLGVWEQPGFRAPILGMLRSAMTGEQGAAMLREFVGSALLGRVAASVGQTDPLRVQAAVAQLVGVVMLRHVIRIEPMASATTEEIVALVAPVVQRHLVG